jgi:multidrug resistance efflux pump
MSKEHHPEEEHFEKTASQFSAFRTVKDPAYKRKLAKTLALIFFILFLTLFLPWTQNIRSYGELTTLNPQDRPQVVNSIIAGRIEKWNVREGQYVKKGDTIALISEVKEKFFDPALLKRIDEQIRAKEGSLVSYRKKAEALQRQIQALRDGLEFSLSKGRIKVRQNMLKLQNDSADFKAMQVELDIARQQFERQEKLYQQGLKSLTEFEQRKLKYQESAAKIISSENKVLAAKNELRNSQIELNSLEAEYLDKISKAESDLSSTLSMIFDTEAVISKMYNDFANMQIRSSFYHIIAPQNGYIVKALKSGIGETISDGDELVSIMPENPKLAVALYVEPMDVPLLEKGRKVRIQFDGWPALVFSGWPNVSFGTFGGLVQVIDYVDTKGKYRILVTPDPEDEAWPPLLRVGSGAYGWAMLRDVQIWYELWRQLNGFPPDFIGTEMDESGEKKDKSDKKKDKKSAEE